MEVLVIFSGFSKNVASEKFGFSELFLFWTV